MIKNDIVKNIIYLIMFFVGFSLICYYSNWQTSLGIFLVLWANNYDIVERLQRDIDE